MFAPNASKWEDQTTSAALTEAADVVLSFAASMMWAGNAASRTRERVEVVARKLGFDAVSVSVSLDSITASLRQSGASTTTMLEIGSPGINAIRRDRVHNAPVFEHADCRGAWRGKRCVCISQR